MTDDDTAPRSLSHKARHTVLTLAQDDSELSPALSSVTLGRPDESWMRQHVKLIWFCFGEGTGRTSRLSVLHVCTSRPGTMHIERINVGRLL